MRTFKTHKFFTLRDYEHGLECLERLEILGVLADMRTSAGQLASEAGWWAGARLHTRASSASSNLAHKRKVLSLNTTHQKQTLSQLNKVYSPHESSHEFLLPAFNISSTSFEIEANLRAFLLPSHAVTSVECYLPPFVSSA